MTNCERKILETEMQGISLFAQELLKKFFDEFDKMKYMLSNIQDLPHEIWRDVINYEGFYQISNMGRLKSLHYGKSTILNSGTARDGYKNVTLTVNGKKNYYRLHILVARAFIPNPENKPCVNHIDGDKSNNRADNLQWVNHSENTQHAYIMGLAKSGYEHHSAKFTPEQIEEIRKNYIPYNSEFGASALARKFHVNIKTVQKIVRGISYKVIN